MQKGIRGLTATATMLSVAATQKEEQVKVEVVTEAVELRPYTVIQVGGCDVEAMLDTG